MTKEIPHPVIYQPMLDDFGPITQEQADLFQIIVRHYKKIKDIVVLCEEDLSNCRKRYAERREKL